MTELTSVSFPSLKTVDGGGLGNLFVGNEHISSMTLPSLETINGTALVLALYVSSKCTVFNLPKAITITGKRVFSTFVTEVHFAAESQDALTSSEGYATKWGATNATIYFDL